MTEGATLSTTTTETLSIPEATNAECAVCGMTGRRASMTRDRELFYCGNELLARAAGNLQRFVDDVAACTQRQIAAEHQRKAERLAAEKPAEDAPHEWQAAAGQAAGGAEQAQEAAGDAAAEDAAPEADGEAEAAPEAEDEPVGGNS